MHCYMFENNFPATPDRVGIIPERSLHLLRALPISAGLVFYLETFVVIIRSFIHSPPLMPRMGRGSFIHAVHSFICLFLFRSTIVALFFKRPNKFHSRTSLWGCACGSLRPLHPIGRKYSGHRLLMVCACLASQSPYRSWVAGQLHIGRGVALPRLVPPTSFTTAIAQPMRNRGHYADTW